MRAFVFLGLCVGLTLGQGYAPPAAPAPPPPPPAAPVPPPAAPPVDPPQIEKLKPANLYDIEGEDIDKGGSVSKVNFFSTE